MIIPEKTKLAGDTCLEDTIKRFYKQHQEEPHKWNEPSMRAKGLINYYTHYHNPYYLLYYQTILEILETQETTPAPINNITGGNITNSIRR